MIIVESITKVVLNYEHFLYLNVKFCTKALALVTQWVRDAETI